MKYLFSDLTVIAARVKKAKHVLFACDFDGTLAEIKRRPDLVYFPPQTKKMFSLLAENKKFKAGIISGRPLAAIKNIVSLDNIFYAGNHGFEIELPVKKKFIHPAAEKNKAFIGSLAGKLKKELAAHRGVLIEDKRYTLSVHYRNCPKEEAVSLKRLVYGVCTPFADEGKIKIGAGKKVIEIAPAVKWDKGEAFSWIKRKMEARFKKAGFLTIYLGDDKTDEDVFSKMKNGISVYVGAKKRFSKAKYYIPGPRQAVKFMRFLMYLD